MVGILGLDDVRQLFACFYADNGLLAAEHLQLMVFNLLTSLFGNDFPPKEDSTGPFCRGVPCGDGA